ncbi:MAG: polysaccharide deacetylase family protein [Granulosicoccus sp.]
MTSESVDNSGDPWALLDAELAAWAAGTQVATMWWRDDDAVAPGQKLDKLVEMTRNTGLLLAVIPARAQEQLASMLAVSSHVQVAQHGYAHINHAPRGQGLGAWELGLHRGMDAVLSDLQAGRDRLEALFGTLFLPVVVPPWNRIAPELLEPIAASNYLGVSAFGPCESINAPSGQASSSLIIANAHCDPIRWKSGAAFAGESKTILQLVAHLQARRSGLVSVSEHTGFLTHHIDLDNAGWAFCSRLTALVESHPGAQWVSPATVFGISS